MSIPSNVERILKKIIANEGGFQNDPDDTGNYAGDELVGTNWGITPQALATFRGVPVEDITMDDMMNLTENEAMDIYAQDYFYKPGYDKIENDYLQENVVDMAVNAGAPRVTKLLQRLAGATEDGVLGPNTLKAVNEKNVNTNDYSTARKQYYLDIVLDDPVKAKYLLGWTNRANKYIVRDYPEEGVIPLDIMAQVDEEVKKPVAALPESSETMARAVQTPQTFASLEYNPDMFYGLGETVDPYQDPDMYVGTINEKALFS